MFPPMSVQVPPLRQGSSRQASETQPRTSSDNSAALTTRAYKSQYVNRIVIIFIAQLKCHTRMNVESKCDREKVDLVDKMI